MAEIVELVKRARVCSHVNVLRNQPFSSAGGDEWTETYCGDCGLVLESVFIRFVTNDGMIGTLDFLLNAKING